MSDRMVSKDNGKQRLRLSPLTSNDEVNGNVTLLGDWCAIGDLKGTRVFGQRTLLKAKYQEEADLCFHLFEKYSKQLADLLNDYHQEKNSVRYWQTLLHPFLYQTIASTIDHYEVLKDIASRDHNLLVEIIDPKREWYSSHLPIGGASRIYHLVVYSIIAKESAIFDCEMVQENIVVRNLEVMGDGKKSKKYTKEPILLLKLVRVTTKYIRDYFSGRINLKLYRYLSSNLLALGDQYLERNAFEKLFTKLKKPPFYAYAENLDTSGFLPKDNNYRAQMKVLDANTPVEKILNVVIANLLPTIFLENYKRVIAQVGRYVPPRKLIIMNSMNCSGGSTLDFFTALSVEKYKSHLILLCHGGCYGAMEVSVQEKVWSTICNSYALWSNPKQYTNQSPVVKLPGLRLFKWYNKFSKLEAPIDGSILLCVTGFYPNRYAYNSIFPYTIDDSYSDWQLRFVKSIAPELLKNLVVRDYHNAARLTENTFFKWIDDNHIKREREISFQQAVKNSKVVIQTVPQTTYLESITMDHPTICFWNPEANLIREDLLKYYSGLETAKVLHFSPESAAKHLSEISENPQKWWRSDEVQLAVSEFRKNVCYSSGETIEQWTEFLQRYESEVL